MVEGNYSFLGSAHKDRAKFRVHGTWEFKDRLTVRGMIQIECGRNEWANECRVHDYDWRQEGAPEQYVPVFPEFLGFLKKYQFFWRSLEDNNTLTNALYYAGNLDEHGHGPDDVREEGWSVRMPNGYLLLDAKSDLGLIPFAHDFQAALLAERVGGTVEPSARRYWAGKRRQFNQARLESGLIDLTDQQLSLPTEELRSLMEHEFDAKTRDFYKACDAIGFHIPPTERRVTKGLVD